MRSRSTAPLLPNLGTTWWSVVNVTPQPVTHRIRGWVGPRASLSVLKKKIIDRPYRERNHALGYVLEPKRSTETRHLDKTVKQFTSSKLAYVTTNTILTSSSACWKCPLSKFSHYTVLCHPVFPSSVSSQALHRKTVTIFSNHTTLFILYMLETKFYAASNINRRPWKPSAQAANPRLRHARTATTTHCTPPQMRRFSHRSVKKGIYLNSVKYRQCVHAEATEKLHSKPVPPPPHGDWTERCSHRHIRNRRRIPGFIKLEDEGSAFPPKRRDLITPPPGRRVTERKPPR